jgi:hypothetical protein
MKRRTRLSAVVTIVALSTLAPAATATATSTATAASAASTPVTATASAAAGAGATSAAPAAYPVWLAPDAEDSAPQVKRMPAERPNLSNLAPGDRTQWAAEITNIGEPGVLGVEFVAHGENSLMSRQGNGLRLVVDFCPTPLIASLTPRGAMTFDCASKQTRLGTVTSAADQRLRSEQLIGTGETVGVRVLISFPKTADNSFENASASIDVVYTITPTGETAGAVPAAPVEAEEVRTVFPGILATGISVMFMSLAAALVISVGILFLSLVPRGARERGEE